MTKIIHLTLIFSLLVLSRAAIDLDKWELFAENTNEVSVRGQRMGRVLASGENSLGFPLQIFNRATQTWGVFNAPTNGLHLQIGLKEDFYITKQRNFYSRARQSGWGLTGDIFPTSFAINEDDDQYIWWVGSSTLSGTVDGYVYRYDREVRETRQETNTAAHTFAVSPRSRKKWCIFRSDWKLWRHVAGLTWLPTGTTARNITFGSTDEPYIISRDAAPEGFLIKKWNATTESWKTIDGISGIFVALDDEDNLYVVTNDKKVYRQRGVPSIYCPMCRENCQTAECTSYQGYCTATRDQCLNCPPGSFAADSPLRCEPCPEQCAECSSNTTCTACPANFYLTPNGTCVASCDAPLVSSTVGGKQMCKGPCANANGPSNIYYHPADGSCRSTCGIPLESSNALFQSCDACPDNCQLCFSTETCEQCLENHYLLADGTCIPSCEAPLISYTESGVAHCKTPCEDEVEDVFYHPADGSCRSTCGIPIENPLYPSCQACTENCQTCSNTETCEQCTETSFMTPNGTCLSTCEGPLVSYIESGVNRCKGPCADEESDNYYYYPVDDSCRSACKVPIVDPTAIYQSCDPCPNDCLECSSTTKCLQCSPIHYLATNGTCLSSCDLPLITEIDEGNLLCKGPCEFNAANPNYYPSNNTCQASCGLDIPGEFYKRCHPCPNDCLECSNTTTCTKCISTSFLTPIGTCRPSCPEPLIPVEVSPENNRCEGPCAGETVNIYYHPNDDTCRPACEVPIMTCSALPL